MSSSSQTNFANADEERSENIASFMEGLFIDDSAPPKDDAKKMPKSSLPKKLIKPVRNITIGRPDVLFPKPSLEEVLDRLPVQELVCYDPYPGLLELESTNVLRVPFTMHKIKHMDILVEIYTGIPNASGFFGWLKVFENNDINDITAEVEAKLTAEQQLLMTLMKLKLNLCDNQLSIRFKCPLDILAGTLKTWLSAIHRIMYDPLVVEPGTKWSQLSREAENGHANLIIHEVIVYSEPPPQGNLPFVPPCEPRRALICCNPEGLIMFASKVYPWVVSPHKMVVDSGVLESLHDGDFVAYREEDEFDMVLPESIVPCPIIATPESPDPLQNLLRGTEESLEKFQILQCLPSVSEGELNRFWHICVIITNYGKTLLENNETS